MRTRNRWGFLAGVVMLCASCAHMQTGTSPRGGDVQDMVGDVHTRVYPVKNLVLLPGEWHGMCLGRHDESAVYFPEVTFIGTAPHGFTIERMVMQQEYNAQKEAWFDILRIKTPESAEQLRVQIRVMKVSDRPQTGEEGGCGCN